MEEDQSAVLQSIRPPRTLSVVMGLNKVLKHSLYFYSLNCWSLIQVEMVAPSALKKK